MLQQFLDRIFSRSATANSSRDTARKRLQLVLAHDRVDLSPAMVEKMREEILEVVSRYVEIEPSESDFALENDQRTTVLIANLPIKRVKKAEPVGQTPLVENFAPSLESGEQASGQSAESSSESTESTAPPTATDPPRRADLPSLEH